MYRVFKSEKSVRIIATKVQYLCSIKKLRRVHFFWLFQNCTYLFTVVVVRNILLQLNSVQGTMHSGLVNR
jgi:hypothetical protein